MWLVAEYQPVTLFSFRSGITTSSGAKTLFLPTPFAIRTALLDAAIRTQGLNAGEAAFDWIKNLLIAVRPPERIVVSNLFTKVLKPTRKENAESAMDSSIAFREYAYLDGSLHMAFGLTHELKGEIVSLLTQINYFGKRGCLFQLMGEPDAVEALPENFIRLDGICVEEGRISGNWPASFALGIIQLMDDWGNDITFSKINVYTEEKIELGKERKQKYVILPYNLIRASKGFSYYKRVG